jgi:2'-5' RNA ligase
VRFRRVAQVERIRSFVAVDIGSEVRAALQTISRELARAGADARWIRPEGMHATLKFLGSVESMQLDAVRSAVERIAGRHDAMRMSARGLGGFPSLRRPRVLWCGLECDGLAELAADIDSELARLGFESEKRPFSAHITLARVKSDRGLAPLLRAIEQHRADEFGAVDIDAVTIYRSTLRRDGAVYDALWTIPLAQHK